MLNSIASLILLISLIILVYYFVSLAISFIVLFGSLIRVGRKMRVVSAQIDLLEEALEPVSILIPAHNEQLTIVDTIHSLLCQDYPQFEIIIINDGSQDDTMSVLSSAFDLTPLKNAREQIAANGIVRGTYISRIDRRVLVLDKENGGKADALNAGIRAARFSLICCADADGILEPNTLKRLACHFARDETVVAVGGVVRPLNGCIVENGRVCQIVIPSRMIERIQVTEYLRAFLTGRFGWERTNSLLIISGALGMFKKQILLDIGGYANTVGEDMELTLRIHKALRKSHTPYRILMAVDAICWTQVPDYLLDLQTQRIRWHKGLTDTLWRHRDMMLNPHYGAVGMEALPVFWLVEWFGPFIELSGYILFCFLLLTGQLMPSAFLFFLMAYLYGLVQSLIAIIAEDQVSRIYANFSDILRLLGVCLLEPVLYRPMLAFWRCSAVLSFWQRSSWGSIRRKRISS